MKEKTKYFIFGVSITVVFVLVFGSVFLLNYIFNETEQIYSFAYMNNDDNMEDFVNVSQVRGLAKNISEVCPLNETSCLTRETYKVLNSTYNYGDSLSPDIEDTKSPKWVIKHKKYDCKSASVTFCSIMKYYNITCYLASTRNHTFTLVGNNTTSIVDVTADGMGYTSIGDYLVAKKVN